MGKNTSALLAQDFSEAHLDTKKIEILKSRINFEGSTC